MEKDLFALSSYQFVLPQELIAQHPCVPRDQSRLMLIDRKSGKITDHLFKDLVGFLSNHDRLIFNDTKVITARLMGRRQGGGNTEILLLKQLSSDTWEALARPGKRLPIGSFVTFGDNFKCEVIETFSAGTKLIRFHYGQNFEDALAQYGQMPLPPYIQRDKKEIADESSYQTVYAANPGAVAAPTAGLHFSEEMLKILSFKGVKQTKVTLHVGMGTFKPVQTDDIRLHPMHGEEFIITLEAAKELNEDMPKHRNICVGTTSCRALESAADLKGHIKAGKYETDIFIYPGYKFKFAESLITNFHLPGSTLLMLVSAFGGYELIMEAYAKAIADKYRFYSYGDAMMIL
ncbi:MAG: tRNA preQ1(34) S-adenosylmethionine ribosyltransferase-isomerase QueA [Parachlamydiaceae bacterium]|nr:tRNA preQ1(34) S-adenosylmethionine ribosyltransferase-isomerase QueA [Parachlamydiaceae bacterium]